MGRKEVVSLVVAASVLGAALLLLRIDRSEPAGPAGEIGALRAEVARIARQVDALASRDDRTPEPASAQGPSTEVAELRTEVRALRRELQTLGRAGSDGAAAGPSPRGGPAETTLSETQLAEQLDELMLRESEGGDARSTAAELTTRIRAALPPGASLREVRCRPSLCRAEMTYPDLEAYQQFVEAHLNGSATGVWAGPTFLQATDPALERGDVIAQAYLARDARVFDPLARR